MTRELEEDAAKGTSLIGGGKLLKEAEKTWDKGDLEYQLRTLLNKIYGMYIDDRHALFLFADLLSVYNNKFLARSNILFVNKEGNEFDFRDK